MKANTSAKVSAKKMMHRDCQGLSEENDAPRQKRTWDVDNSLHRLCHGDNDKEKSDQTVEKEKVEILVVEEADAVVHPWTVVIHLQDASLASPALVSPVRLVFAAPLAISPLSTPLLLFDEAG